MIMIDFFRSTPRNSIKDIPRQSSGRLNRTSRKVLLLTTVLVGAIVIAEIALRFFLPAPARWRIQPAEFSTSDSARSSVVIPTHPSQGGLFEIRGVHKRLRTNVDAVITNHKLSGQPVRISTNSLGMRHPELGPKNSNRILFLGDSITLADYLPDHLTFVRLVEELASKDGRNWECVNAGIGAVGLDSEVALYFEIEDKVDPDIVILNLYLNDFSDSIAWVDRLPVVLHHSYLVTYTTTIVMQIRALLADDDPGLKRLDGWRKDFEDSLKSEGRTPTQLENEALRRFRDWGGAWSHHTWEAMRPTLEQLATETRASDRKLLLVLHPVRDQVESLELHDTPQRYFLDLAADLKLPALDLLPSLREAYATNHQPLFFDHCHHTQRGAEIVAGEIYRAQGILDT
jgi:hypothetical protein